MDYDESVLDSPLAAADQFIDGTSGAALSEKTKPTAKRVSKELPRAIYLTRQPVITFNICD